MDVAGGIGHQCAALRKRWPRLAGRVVLQDAPEVLANALATEGVESVMQDFGRPQAIRGGLVASFNPTSSVFVLWGWESAAGTTD